MQLMLEATPRGQVLLACYDGTSRVPGTSLGADCLWQALCGARADDPDAPPWPAVRLADESKSSMLWCQRLRRHATQHPVALALGGEHLISFPLLEVLAARHPGLRVVVLDAHHDAYDYPLLTHFSVFHHVRHELGLPTLIVGARHELHDLPAGCEVLPGDELARVGSAGASERIRGFVGDGPFYFSVDLDVLDPAELAAVSAPVAGGLDVAGLVELTRAALELGPVAADIVEYNPLRDTPAPSGLRRLRPFFAEVARWLG